jgi:2-octaprenylphenol hydroxylase
VKSNYDIVIVGGGMVGATLACALGGSRLKVAVLEQRAPAPLTDEYDLRVSAITLASRALFENIGAWQAMTDKRVARVEAMQVWDENGSGSIHFDAAEIGEPELAYIIENRVIQQALVARLAQFTNVHWLCPVEVERFDLAGEHPLVTLRDGRALEARLLVGADGAASRVRSAAGIGIRRLGLDQTGIVATVRIEHAHEHIARQKFLATGPLAFLPLPEPHTCSIVWSADSARAEALMALDDAAFRTELQAAFGSALGVVESVSARAALPLALSHAHEYVHERVALVGDAAHTVHPLAGQGVNLGFLDAAQLAEVLLAAQEREQDIGAFPVLRRYERARKADNFSMVAMTGGFRYLFSNRLPGLTTLRNRGLDLVDAATPLKYLIVRRASGLDGDLPRLACRPVPRAATLP